MEEDPLYRIITECYCLHTIHIVHLTTAATEYLGIFFRSDQPNSHPLSRLWKYRMASITWIAVSPIYSPDFFYDETIRCYHVCIFHSAAFGLQQSVA